MAPVGPIAPRTPSKPRGPTSPFGPTPKKVGANPETETKPKTKNLEVRLLLETRACRARLRRLEHLCRPWDLVRLACRRCLLRGGKALCDGCVMVSAKQCKQLMHSTSLSCEAARAGDAGRAATASHTRAHDTSARSLTLADPLDPSGPLDPSHQCDRDAQQQR